MKREQKILILVIAPNDKQISQAVESWEERGYCVETHSISDVSTAYDDLMRFIHTHHEVVRVLFTESAWGSIPHVDQCCLIHQLTINPKVRWIHWAKR